MADDSNIVFRWVINNARATLAPGRVKSGVFDAGGFKWVGTLYKITDVVRQFGALFLRCGVDHKGPWKCDVKLSSYIHRAGGQLEQLNTPMSEMIFSLSERNRLIAIERCMFDDYMILPHECNINDKVTFEFHIQIISSDRGEPIADPSRFSVPNGTSNVILKIEDNILHVSKEILAIHSPVFETMFFGNFAEKGKEEVEIKDVVFEEFIHLLYLIFYPGEFELTDRKVLHILKLADRYQMKKMIEKAELYLVHATGFDDKLIIADQYRLEKLRDHCLQSFTSSEELNQKCESFEWQFSEDMKSAIHDRLAQI